MAQLLTKNQNVCLLSRIHWLFLKKIDSKNLVLFARHPNSNNDQSSESWQIEHSATQFARANKKYKSANDLMYENAQGTLDDYTLK